MVQVAQRRAIPRKSYALSLCLRSFHSLYAECFCMCKKREMQGHSSTCLLEQPLRPSRINPSTSGHSQPTYIHPCCVVNTSRTRFAITRSKIRMISRTHNSSSPQSQFGPVSDFVPRTGLVTVLISTIHLSRYIYLQVWTVLDRHSISTSSAFFSCSLFFSFSFLSSVVDLLRYLVQLNSLNE